MDLVVVLFPSALVTAMWHCIKEECHIITMSFGGLVGPAFGDVVREAYLHNIILCAAAGNCVGFVVEPALLPEVIGCGAIGIDASGTPHLWPGTSQGAGVDISAPGEHVWIADWRDGQAVVLPSQGTSFAAPAVAGSAALWLEHHGRQALLARYAPSGLHLGDVFKEVVRSSAQVPAGWDTSNNGAGIVDLLQLMQEPLPTAVAATPLSSELLDLIPLQVAPVKAVIELDRLIVRDDGEFFGGAEPYLLVTFFKIDGNSAMIEATLDPVAIASGNSPLRVEMKPLPGRDSIVIIDKRGGHGNVAPVNIGPSELAADGPKTIRIPNAIGLFRTEVAPIPIRLTLSIGLISTVLDLVGLPGFVGVHALLSEEDFTPDNAITAARNVIAKGIRGILEEVLSTIELSDLSVNLADFVERQAEIADAAAAAAAAQMNPWELLWGGVVDPDDQLIPVFAIANVLELGESKQISERYQGEHGDWLLRGEIRT